MVLGHGADGACARRPHSDASSKPQSRHPRPRPGPRRNGLSFCRQERRVADDQPKHPPVDASRRGDNRRQEGVAQAGSHVSFPIFVDLLLRPLPAAARQHLFVGGIWIPPDYARTRSQSRQVKRRVVIDQPSRTKYYTGCPVLHCGHVPYLEWLSTAPSKTNLVFAIRLAQQALPSRSARASPREVYAAPRRPQDPPLRPPQRC